MVVSYGSPQYYTICLLDIQPVQSSTPLLEGKGVLQVLCCGLSVQQNCQNFNTQVAIKQKNYDKLKASSHNSQ